jgi:hypothetical protein
MKNPDSPAARFSELKPPHVFRPLETSPEVQNIYDLMNRLNQEEVVRKPHKRYRLDTLLVRETRLVSYLGQSAIDSYIDTLQKLGEKGGWFQPVTTSVSKISTNPRKGGTGNRIIMELETNEQLEKEREWALEITRRLTGLDTPHMLFRRNITLALLDRNFVSGLLQERLDEVKPQSVTLNPTVIEYTTYKRSRPGRQPAEN